MSLKKYDRVVPLSSTTRRRPSRVRWRQMVRISPRRANVHRGCSIPR